MSSTNIIGTSGPDAITGTASDDRISGGSGNDTIRGGGGRDTIDGGRGDDLLVGGDDKDFIAGGPGEDTLIGRGGNDLLIGGADHDMLIGGEGNDTLVGGAGWDGLSGGSGNDVFKYNAVSESKLYDADIIYDFEVGKDKIDLSAIDANTFLKGNQAFDYVQHDPTKALQAGEVTSYANGAYTRIEGSVDGNPNHNLIIDLRGDHQLSASDFVL